MDEKQFEALVTACVAEPGKLQFLRGFAAAVNAMEEQQANREGGKYEKDA